MKTRYYNGNIYTMDESIPHVSSFIVDEGKIVSIGSDEQTKQNDIENIDLKQQTVFPGFIDSHVHLAWYGKALKQIPTNSLSKQQIVDLVKKAIEKAQPGEWIIGSVGWKSDDWDDTSIPTIYDLDAISRNNPVYLPKFDTHSVWVNSYAMKLAGIDDSTADPIGGQIYRDEKGKATGFFAGTAKEYIDKVLPSDSQESLIEDLLRAQKQLLEYGITSIQETHTPLEVIAVLKDLYSSGKMQLRINTAIMINPGEDVNTVCKGFVPKKDLVKNKWDDIALKILVDGTFSSYTAALREPFSDRKDATGNLSFTDEQMEDIFNFCIENGYQLIGHCIGDKACEQFIATCEKIGIGKTSKYRFRMEHFHYSPDDLLQRVKQGKIVVSVQPTHGPFNPNIGPTRLGEERMKQAYLYRKMFDQLDVVAMGSDCPVETANPLHGIYAAVERKKPNTNMKTFYKNGAVTRHEAFKAYTVNGAYAMFHESDRGSLVVGKNADFIILDHDICKCDMQTLANAKVLKTYIDGRCVFELGKE